MIVGGNKYACEACVRGHRVSNCQHVDRPLQQISRKGRPISQCQHCRVMRKSRSAHIKCDCGAPARNMMLEKQSVEGNNERCFCNEGGRCTCAYKKELPRMGAVPGDDSDKDSKTSARSNGGRQRAEEYYHNQVPADNAKQSQKIGPSKLNHASPIHSNSNLHNGSPNNIPPGTSRGFPNGSLEGHASHEQQSWGTTGTASAFLHSTPASPTIHESDNQLPILDLFTTIDSNFELFGDLLDAEQHEINAWQTAINDDWRTHEFSTGAGYYQAQRFNSFDSCGSQQPPLSNTITTTSAGVPLTATMDATAGDWWLTMPSLSDPDICTAPPASDGAPNITHISPSAVPSKRIPNQALVLDTQHQMTPTYGIISDTSSDRQSAPSEARELEGNNSHFWVNNG